MSFYWYDLRNKGSRIFLIEFEAKCYKNAWSDFTAKMAEEEKIGFLNEILSLYTCNSNLYKFRNRFILKSLSTTAEFDTNCDWFLMDDTRESICMPGIKIGNRRIVILIRILKIHKEKWGRSKSFDRIGDQSLVNLN